MRDSFYDLERAYGAVKQQYDGELERLRHELNLARTAIEQQQQQQQQRQMLPPSPPVPSPSAYSSDPSRQPPYYSRDRENGKRERERERDPRSGVMGPDPRDPKRFKPERELGQRRLSGMSRPRKLEANFAHSSVSHIE
jgi:hypothetical protein